MMDKTVLNRAAARLSELWILYPFTGSNCKKTVSNQRAGFPHRMQVLLPIALTTWPLFRSVRKTFHRIRNFGRNCSAAQCGAPSKSISFCKYRRPWRLADMAALRNLADDNQLALLAARATADIDAADEHHQLAGILGGWFTAWGQSQSSGF
jgi:predicted nucleotidyltransferase